MYFISFADFYYMFLPSAKELTNVVETKMLAFHGASSRLKFVHLIFKKKTVFFRLALPLPLAN